MLSAVFWHLYFPIQNELLDVSNFVYIEKFPKLAFFYRWPLWVIERIQTAHLESEDFRLHSSFMSVIKVLSGYYTKVVAILFCYTKVKKSKLVK